MASAVDARLADLASSSACCIVFMVLSTPLAGPRAYSSRVSTRPVVSPGRVRRLGFQLSTPDGVDDDRDRGWVGSVTRLAAGGVVAVGLTQWIAHHGEKVRNDRQARARVVRVARVAADRVP